MATNRLRYDFVINGKGFLLYRDPQGGRSWNRTSTPDTPVKVFARSEEGGQYGGVDPQVDYPEVWDDWSGGYGYDERPEDRPNTYRDSINFDARFPGQLILCQDPQLLYSARFTPTVNTANWALIREGATGVADGVFSFSGSSQLSFERVVVYGKNGMGFGGLDVLATRNFNFDICHTISQAYDLLHPAALYGSAMYFGNRGGTCFAYVNPAGSCLIASMSGFRFAVAGNQLWRAHGPNPDRAIYLQNCGNPNGVATAANWGATYNIGDNNSTIHSLIGYDDQIFAGTPKGLYAGDQTGTFINVLSQLSQQVHPDNCRDLAIFEGAIVAPHVAGIFAYRPSNGSIDDLSLPRSTESPIQGQIRAIRSYGRWLYAGLYTGSESYLLAGERKFEGNNQSRIAWHPLQKFSEITKVGRIFVDGLSTYSITPVPNNMWVTTEASTITTGTAPVYYWPIPTLDGNPRQPTPGFTPRFVASARIDFGSVNAKAPGVRKLYRSVEIWSENFNNIRTGAVYYELDGCGSWALLGGFSSPKAVQFFPASESSFVTGYSIRLRLEVHIIAGKGTSVSPVVKSVILRSSLDPEYIDEITATARIADGMRDRQNFEMPSAKNMMNHLRSLAPADSHFASTYIHRLVDPVGEEWWVKVLGPPQEREIYPGRGENERPEIAATIKMAVMTFSKWDGDMIFNPIPPPV